MRPPDLSLKFVDIYVNLSPIAFLLTFAMMQK